MVNGNDGNSETKKQDTDQRPGVKPEAEGGKERAPSGRKAGAGWAAGGAGRNNPGRDFENPPPGGKGFRPENDEEEEGEDFGALFEESVKKREVEENEIIRGVVVGIHKEQVMVDIGDKSEGYVPVEEFRSPTGELQVKVGDELEVMVERRDEEDGVIRLSKEKASKRRIWDELEDAFRNNRSVPGKIVEKVKGGLIVDVGVRAFMPGSQADSRPLRNLEKLLGVEDRFMIIKFNRRRGNVVVSRRVVMEKEQEDKRTETLARLEKDQVVKGVVKNITDYGAFLDLGGIDGLLHITDMSYGRINHPSEIMKVGDTLTVKVLKFNRETEKVSLGLKQILPDPWDNVEKKYPIGTIVTGRVVSVTDYGAFVELERGVEGLVHVSEMNWAKKRTHPSKLVKPDQEVEAKVLDIDRLNRRISLSIKQAQPNPWDLLELKYPAGSRITGKIRNITNFGVFVGVEEGIDGLVHISDLSWTKRVKHPSELFKKGQEITCVVLKIDKDHERFSLGIKQAQPDPWDLVPSKYRPGDEVTGKVVNITDFGVFVELEEGIEGLIHISELSHEKVKDPSEMAQEGQKITAEILNVDISERKIRLSLKARERTEDQAALRSYQKQEGDGTSKLGEIIQDKLAQARKKEGRESDPGRGAGKSKASAAVKKESPASEAKEENDEPSSSPATPAAEAKTSPPPEETSAAPSAEAAPPDQPAPGEEEKAEKKASAPEEAAGEESSSSPLGKSPEKTAEESAGPEIKAGDDEQH